MKYMSKSKEKLTRCRLQLYTIYNPVFCLDNGEYFKDEQVVVRKMMNVALLFDHRAMMANTPIEFLNELKMNLEEPDTYLA